MASNGGFLAYFGEELRLHRERAGLTQSDVGQRVGYGNGLVSKIERAERVPREELARALDALFDARGFFARLWERVREDTSPSERFREYLDREPNATALFTYEAYTAPGLLQTEDYARAVIEAVRPSLRHETAAALLATRMTRQELLDRDPPPRVWVILDEAVLHRIVGSEKVMAEQLQRIIELATERPEVVVQVLPYSAGATCAMGVPFLLAEFPAGPPILHIDAPPGVQTSSGPDTVAGYGLLYDYLRASALPERESLAVVHARVEELEQ